MYIYTHIIYIIYTYTPPICSIYVYVYIYLLYVAYMYIYIYTPPICSMHIYTSYISIIYI